MGFNARVREINRKYEEDNNQNVDNGVYNQFETEESDDSPRAQKVEVDEAILNRDIKAAKERAAEMDDDDMRIDLTPLEVASRMQIN